MPVEGKLNKNFDAVERRSQSTTLAPPCDNTEGRQGDIIEGESIHLSYFNFSVFDMQFGP